VNKLKYYYTQESKLDFKTCLLFLLPVLFISSAEAYIEDPAVIQRSEKYQADLRVARDPTTWQFLGTLGMGIPVMSSTQDQKEFASHSGFGIPLHVGFAVFHPREKPASIHWGYSLDFMEYSKKNRSLFFADSAGVGQALLGASVLYYLNDRRTWFLRSSLGLAGITYEQEIELLGKKATIKENQYSNGYGFLVELGNSFKSETYAEIFTYSLTVGAATAFSRSGIGAELAYVAANVGFLW